MSALWIILLLGPMGCEFPDSSQFVYPDEITDSADTALDGSCPAGWTIPSSVDLAFSTFNHDTLALAAILDETRDACVNDAGTSATLPFEVGGEPWGILSFAGAEEGTLVLGEYDGSVTVTVTGSETTSSFTEANWSQSTWTTDETGDSLSTTFDGAGLNDALSSLSIHVSAIVTQ